MSESSGELVEVPGPEEDEASDLAVARVIRYDPDVPLEELERVLADGLDALAVKRWGDRPWRRTAGPRYRKWSEAEVEFWVNTSRIHDPDFSWSEDAEMWEARARYEEVPDGGAGD